MKKTPGKPSARRRRGKYSLWRMALAICGAHGVPASIRQDVATNIVANIHRTPTEKIQAFAHRSARRAVAADLGLAEREIPESRAISNAIAQYEYARKLRQMWQRRSMDKSEWTSGFDYHSRQFAIENGVCPRCTAPGDFCEDHGVCECGFKY